MDKINTPNFGELLAPHIGQVEPSAVPSFLALLERGAAARYRDWAEQMPRHRDGLLACFAREDEIADVIEKLHPVSAELQAEIERPLPAARDLYYSAFSNFQIKDQLAIQADAELQGVAAWRAMITGDTPAELLAGLEHCAQLEEVSSTYLREILAD